MRCGRSANSLKSVGAEPAVEQDLPHQAPERVTDDDGRLGQCPDKGVVMVGDIEQTDVGGCLGAVEDLVERGNSGPGRCVHDMAGGEVAVDPAAPAVRCHPQAVNQHNRRLGRVHRF